MFVSPLFAPVLPEIVLAVGTLALLLYGVFGGDRTATLVNGLAVVLLALVGLVVAGGDGRVDAFSGVFIVDGFARFLKLLVLVGSAAVIIVGNDYLRREGVQRFEFALVILLATVGMMLMVSANDLISLYLGLELQSLAAYVVAALHRDHLKSTEAGLKYFVLGALSSGMLLYGASLIYGFSGHTTFVGIAAAVHGQASLGLVFGLVFLMAGLAFKISAVPFHMWTPDVYEGAPTPVTAFFAGAPKMAAMGLTVRVVMTAFPGIVHEWQQIIVFIALASMALGAFAAIGQTNIKRLMAYSSISHMGYALVGLAAGTQEGVQGVLIYLAIYLAMTVGVFTVILSMRRAGQYVETIGDLAGLSRTQPGMAIALAVLMWSLAGLPPFAGFFGKFYTFLAAVHAGLYALAALGFVASVVGAYYYLRIIKLMYFDEPATRFEPMLVQHRVVLAVSAALTAFFIVWPGLITGPAALAARSLF